MVTIKRRNVSPQSDTTKTFYERDEELKNNNNNSSKKNKVVIMPAISTTSRAAASAVNTNNRTSRKIPFFSSRRGRLQSQQPHKKNSDYRQPDEDVEDDINGYDDNDQRNNGSSSQEEQRDGGGGGGILQSDHPKHNNNPNNIYSKPRKHSMATLPTLLYRWIGLLVLISTVRVVWNSTTITKREGFVIHEEPSYSTMLIDSPHYVRSSKKKSSSSPQKNQQLVLKSNNQEERKKRTKPINSLLLPKSISRITNNANNIYPSFPITTLQYDDSSMLCQNSNGRTIQNETILITGIISHPLPSELTLSLIQQCHVQNTITGLVEHTLDVEQTQRLHYLMRRIPTLKIHFSKYPLQMNKLQELFEKVQPTLIIHFDPTSYGPNKHSQEMFTDRASMDQLERLCKTIVQQQQQQQQQHNTKITIQGYIHVTSADHNFDSSSSTMSRSTINTFLMQTYRSKYQLDAQQINLPTLYGPFWEGMTWFNNSNFIDGWIMGTDPSIDKMTTIKVSATTQQPLIHISDAIKFILHSVVSIDSKSTISVPSSEITTNIDELSNEFQNIANSREGTS